VEPGSVGEGRRECGERDVPSPMGIGLGRRLGPFPEKFSLEMAYFNKF